MFSGPSLTVFVVLFPRFTWVALFNWPGGSIVAPGHEQLRYRISLTTVSLQAVSKRGYMLLSQLFVWKSPLERLSLFFCIYDRERVFVKVSASGEQWLVTDLKNAVDVSSSAHTNGLLVQRESCWERETWDKACGDYKSSIVTDLERQRDVSPLLHHNHAVSQKKKTFPKEHYFGLICAALVVISFAAYTAGLIGCWPCEQQIFSRSPRNHTSPCWVKSCTYARWSPTPSWWPP